MIRPFTYKVSSSEPATTESTERTTARGFFRPGIWVTTRIGRGLVALLKLMFAAFAAVLALLASKTYDVAVPGWLAIVAIALIAIAGYLSESQTECDRATKAAAELRAKEAADVAFETLKDYKTQIAGPMAFLACAIVDTRPLESVRMAILSHVVDVARKHLGLEAIDRRLSATWSVPRDNYAQWEVVAYDRYHAERQPGTRRPITSDKVGAPRAFLTGDYDFVVDTQAPEVKDQFVAAPYRSILSVPARILNVKKMPTRNINGRQSAILGVLNVDCTAVGVLRADLRFLVQDAAFLLGIVDLGDSE